jgi:hypothetical protein
MRRDEAALEISRRLSILMAEASLGTEDEPGDLKEPLDDTLRLMGYSELDLLDAEPSDVPALLTVLRYFTLRTIVDRLTVNFDLSTEGDSFRLSQVQVAAQKLLASAATDVLSIYGKLTMSSSAAAMIQIDLNFKGLPNASLESFA